MNWGATATSVPDGCRAVAPADASVVRGPANPAQPALGHHAGVREPAGRGLERLDRGPGRIPQLLTGPADVEDLWGGDIRGRFRRNRRVRCRSRALHSSETAATAR